MSEFCEEKNLVDLRRTASRVISNTVSDIKKQLSELILVPAIPGRHRFHDLLTPASEL